MDHVLPRQVAADNSTERTSIEERCGEETAYDLGSAVARKGRETHGLGEGAASKPPNQLLGTGSVELLAEKTSKAGVVRDEETAWQLRRLSGEEQQVANTQLNSEKLLGCAGASGFPVAQLEHEGSDDTEDRSSLDLPQVAGNLSPRMVAIPEASSASLVVELNIDQVGGALKGFAKPKGRRAST